MTNFRSKTCSAALWSYFIKQYSAISPRAAFLFSCFGVSVGFGGCVNIFLDIVRSGTEQSDARDACNA